MLSFLSFLQICTTSFVISWVVLFLSSLGVNTN
jgi:hypothetical protein